MTDETRYDVAISQAAYADLESIGDYLRDQFSSERAAEFVATVTERILRLETFPLRGSVPPEAARFGPSRYRQIVVGLNRVIYSVDGQQVTVVMIADGRRDLYALLRDRLMRKSRKRD